MLHLVNIRKKIQFDLMAKRQISRRAATNKDGSAFEHTENHDDNLLPDVEQIERYAALDPKIVEFLKEATLKEQAHRHQINLQQVELMKSGQRRGYRMDRYQIVCAFLVFLSGMVLTVLLMYWDKEILGSIFGGGILLLGVKAFLGFRFRSPKDTDKIK